MAELHLLRGDEVVYVRPVGESPLYIGRAPTNDLVLTDRNVSGRHAVVWAAGGVLHVEDLGSKNGTFVDERRVEAQVVLADGAVLRLGRQTRLRVVCDGSVASEGRAPALVVEDLVAGVRIPVRSDRFTIGSAPAADLPRAGLPHRAATLVFHDNGEAWLGTDDEERALGVDEVFEVGPLRLALREVADERTRTERAETTRYPYRLIATLDGPTGPQAVVETLEGTRRHVVDTEHRATLLYLLARRLGHDLQEGLAPNARGWLTDEEVAVGVWGRERHRLEPNNYHVLVCRLRKELSDAGFDGWFIEKKRKHIRARLEAVVVD